MKNLCRLLASIAVSALLVGLLLRLPSTAGAFSGAELLHGLRSALPPLVAAYLIAQIIQAAARALRSIILLKASCGTTVKVPGLYHMALVTFVRGACADLLPARIGELSYVAMLNKGHRIPAADAFSSLSIGLLFDFLALLGVLVVAIPGATQGIPLLGSAALLVLLCLAGTWGLFFFLPWFSKRTARFDRLAVFRWRPVAALLKLVRDLSEAVASVRRARIAGQILLLSLLIRAAKYTGLYFLFLAVTRPLWPGLSEAGPFAVLVALIAAEGAASLPVPTFLGFGTYEAGGLAALTALGFRAGDSMAAMLTMHVLSQIIDYSLGAGAFLLHVWRTKENKADAVSSSSGRGRRLFVLAAGCALAAACALFAAFQYRAAIKRGRLAPPKKGDAASPSAEDLARRNALLPSFHGRIVWSSNRNGLHDLYLATYPEGRVERLTRSGMTDTYPRFSPDGNRIAFSRSQSPWVSQRDWKDWDTYVIDLKTGIERRIATNAFMAVWTPDGQSLVYMAEGGLAINRVSVNRPDVPPETLLRAGEKTIPPGLRLSIPDVRDGDPWLAVTIRGARRQTAFISRKGEIVPMSGGCQLTWRGNDGYAWVERPGKMKNAFYHARPGEARALLLDATDDYSHEYFPAFSADGRWLVYGASTGGHEQDSEDYEIFLWDTARPGLPPARLTFHTGNDCWPDIHAAPSNGPASPQARPDSP